ncbi:MAG: hypothetical protein KDH09_18140 [Chrysiogenetes bacterium]|nr:hypothetical protein [Chrysiogenetes bacterium]
MSGGTLLIAAFVMPVVRACDDPVYPYEFGLKWGGFVPEYLFGLAVLIALAVVALRGDAMLGRAGRALRLYVVLWGIRNLSNSVWQTGEDILSNSAQEWENWALGAFAALALSLVYLSRQGRFSSTRILGRSMWVGGILWAPLLMIAFDEVADELMYGFWVTLLALAMIVVGGAWIEREEAQHALTGE